MRGSVDVLGSVAMGRSDDPGGPVPRRGEGPDPSVPGKQSLAQSVSPQDADVELWIALEFARQRAVQLERAIGAVDFCGAWCTATLLWNALARVEKLMPAANPDTLEQVRAVRTIADPLLALAPAPSPMAIQEATSRDRHAPRAAWDAEERCWKAARGGLVEERAGPLRGSSTERPR